MYLPNTNQTCKCTLQKSLRLHHGRTALDRSSSPALTSSGLEPTPPEQPLHLPGGRDSGLRRRSEGFQHGLRLLPRLAPGRVKLHRIAAPPHKSPATRGRALASPPPPGAPAQSPARPPRHAGRCPRPRPAPGDPSPRWLPAQMPATPRPRAARPRTEAGGAPAGLRRAREASGTRNPRPARPPRTKGGERRAARPGPVPRPPRFHPGPPP